MDKQPVGQLPDLASSNNDDEIMVITNSEYSQLKKEKISDLITDFTSTNKNNALTKGTDGKLFVTDFGNASNITEGTLPTSVLPDIPKSKLPDIETADLPVSGVTADTYAYPSSVTVNAQGQVTAIEAGEPGANNANQDLSNISEAGKEVIRENSGGGLEICDIGMALYVDETKGLRRWLNGQLVVINSNTQKFLTRLKEIKATDPDRFTNEDNWQAEKLLSPNGYVDKFVIADDESTVRLPNYPEYIISELSDTIPAKGNGMTLGLTNGSLNAGISYTSTAGLTPASNLFGELVTTSNVGNTSSTSFGAGAGVGVTTDSSKSGIIADTSNLAGKLKLRYFIQIATGQETKAEIINTLELNNPYTLFDCKYSETKLYNIAWLRSEGQWNSKATHPKAFEALLVEQNPEIADGTTVELPSGTSYTKRGVSGGISAKLSTESYDDYDFVINPSDETFRLPIKIKLAGSKFAKGNGIALGLTDGEKLCGLATYSNSNLEGNEGDYGKPVGSTISGQDLKPSTVVGITPDSSKSGIELDDTNLYLYYYVGETVQNANLINAGRIEEKLVDINSPDRGYLVESYRNGNSWYRVYSDGWCEQGSITSGAATYGVLTVQLLKPYRDTNYVYVGNAIWDTSWYTSADGAPQASITDMTSAGTNWTASSFAVNKYLNRRWYCAGYLY